MTHFPFSVNIYIYIYAQLYYLFTSYIIAKNSKIQMSKHVMSTLQYKNVF